MLYEIMTRRVDILNQTWMLERNIDFSRDIDAEMYFLQQYKYNPGYAFESLRLFRINSEGTRTLIATNQFETM